MGKDGDTGVCPTCNYSVRLTPKGYLQSHDLLIRGGNTAGLVASPRDLLLPGQRGIVKRCAGGGSRPAPAR